MITEGRNKCRYVLFFLVLSLLLVPGLYAQDETAAETETLQVPYQTNATEARPVPVAGEVREAEKAVVGGLATDFGIVAHSDAYIQMIDLTTMTLSPPLLRGQLGSASGLLLDVAITPDTLTALVSNFGDGRVYILDITNRAAPWIRGRVRVPIFAEDIDITPDGKYALVTDGGFSPYIVVIDIAKARVRQTLYTPGAYLNSVSITPDGQTVLCADYFMGAVHVLTMNRYTGLLSYRAAVDVNPYMPVNTAISPDGRTVLVCTSGNWDKAEDSHDLPVLRVERGGWVRWVDTLMLPSQYRQIQSAVFTSDNRQAYFLSQEYIGEDKSALPPEIYFLNQVHGVEVLGPGQLELTGTIIPVQSYTSNSLFGVDVLAIDSGNMFLFASNKSLSGSTSEITVISLWYQRQIMTLKASSLSDNDFPAGIAIPTKKAVFY